MQDTQEQQITMVLATQDGIDVSFTSAERTMQLQDYVERILAPKIAFLTADVAYTIMSGLEGSCANIVSNVDGAGNITHPTQFTVLNARAILTNQSAPPGQRKLVYDPVTGASMVSTLSGLFNPVPAISRQYMEGMMYDALGFRWYEDQTVIKHTTGTYTAGTVHGAGQTGITSLVTNAITGTLKAGDIITVASVNAINRLTRQSLGTLRQFVVTADVLTNAVAIPIYPALVAPVGGVGVQYQTVDASPADGATILLFNKPSEVYRKNLAYTPDAFTMATADLELPEGVWERSRSTFDGVSMRSILAYNPGTDQAIDRLDVLFGFLGVKPEWACAVADSV